MKFILSLTLALFVSQALGDDRIISVDKPAKQSSTFRHYNAQLAVDSRSYQDARRGSCAQTNAGKPWWEVDLVYDYRITQITVHLDAVMGENMGEFTVEVFGKNHNNKRVYGHHKGATGKSKVYYFAKEKFHVQYVRISHSSNKALIICEVTVIGEREKAVDDYKEVAQRAFATQSSTKGHSYPHLAVDGDLQQDSKKYACTSTNKQLKAWWMVDLHHFYSIDTVVIYGNINGDNTGGLNVQTKKKGAKKWLFCGQTTHNGNGAINVVKCNYKVGQMLRVITNDHRALSLCEVRVYGRRAFTDKEKKHAEHVKREAKNEDDLEERFEQEED